MKVIYRNIFDDLNDIIYKAEKYMRKIEKIELTRQEWNEFRTQSSRSMGFCISPCDESAVYLGVRIELTIPDRKF